MANQSTFSYKFFSSVFQMKVLVTFTRFSKQGVLSRPNEGMKLNKQQNVELIRPELQDF